MSGANVSASGSREREHEVRTQYAWRKSQVGNIWGLDCGSICRQGNSTFPPLLPSLPSLPPLPLHLPCKMLVLATIALLAASLVRAETHTVAVGANGNTFDPTSITANPGDIVTFSLYVAVFPPSSIPLTTCSRYSKAGSHTATQSTFASPCTALQGGVDSGPYVLLQVPSHALKSPTHALLIVNPLLVLPHRLHSTTP